MLCVFCSCLVYVELVGFVFVFVFFFKQKTAYEMRISDWSSDVCSSDLARGDSHRDHPALAVPNNRNRRSAVLDDPQCDVLGYAVEVQTVAPAGCAVSWHVERDALSRVAQRPNLFRPEATLEEQAVEKEHGWSLSDIVPAIDGAVDRRAPQI